MDVFFAKLLIVLGLSAIMVGFGCGFYVVIYSWKYANPREHTNPDWLTVAWRVFRHQITAFVVLIPIGFALIGLATFIGRHASF